MLFHAIISDSVTFSGVFDKNEESENIEDIENEALKRSIYGPIQTGSKEKMLNGDIFIAKINLEGQEHRLFFEVKFQSRILLQKISL